MEDVSTMTWSELKLLTLQLMFSNETAVLTEDDSNQEYLNAMPGVANAGISIITAFLPVRGKFVIEISAEVTEAVTGTQSLTLPVNAAVAYQIDLKDYCPDFRCIDADEIYLDRDGAHGHMTDWRVENGSVLVLDGGTAETVTIWYEAYPEKLTAQTAADANLNLPREAAELLPLYMAGELYKDDDLSMAAQYRNEFEDALQKLRDEAEKRPAGSGNYQNTTGWW